MELFQSIEQPLQAVRQADGAGGVGHQEGAHDQQHDTQHHEHGVPQARVGDMEEAPLHQITVPGGEKQIQDAGEDDDEQHRLQAPHQCFDADLGDVDTYRQTQGHEAVGHQALGAEQGDDIQDHQQDLRPGVQLVGHGVSGEVLAQGNIFQHGAPPFRSASSSRSSASTV